MQKLTDKVIRQALIANLRRRLNAPLATLEEVHVCNSNAIADVVAVYKKMHCYEIKGETDSITRIARQASFYDQAFSLISLVTTENHLKRAEIIIPNHWGIILAKESGGAVSLRNIRGASKNSLYRPEIALLSLWRSELIQFANVDNISLGKMNRQKIAELIASNASINVINQGLGRALAAREKQLSMLDNYLPCT
ncbi:sce7726 family protein [Comamonas sp. JNW]|uniref:sce7726 family protein n=1 Tax=Comamonas sp. JNW TaxID=2170731 RepID=UPI001057F3EF|nr:sce7726 family protein [Comamonas sp. JNW]